jgi:hypothetical protein
MSAAHIILAIALALSLGIPVRAQEAPVPAPTNFAAEDGCGPYVWWAPAIPSPAPAPTAPRAVARKRTPPSLFARSELFFGTARPDGTVVTEAEWKHFLDAEVTPRFPSGLTTLTGVGQFKDAEGEIVRERSVVLILLYPDRERQASDRKIEEIREAYKRAFLQESVLRVDDPRPAQISF